MRLSETRTRVPSVPWLLVTIVLLLLRQTTAFIGADGKCSLIIFAPFTHIASDGTRGKAFGSLLSEGTSVGHSQLAGAIMAAQEFNQRNSSVVPELADLDDCSVTIDLEFMTVVDSGLGAQESIRAMSDWILTSGPIPNTDFVREPCAALGPSSDLAAEQLSVLAAAAEFPILVTRNYNMQVVSDFYNPYTSALYPDTRQTGEVVGQYLEWKGRTNFVAILYDLTDTGVQRFEVLRLVLDGLGIQWMAQPFFPQTSDLGNDADLVTPLDALSEIKRRGFRTIVVCMDNPFDSLQAIADAVVALKMDAKGENVFVFHDRFEPSLYANGNNANITRLVKGSSWVLPVPDFRLDSNHSFNQLWESQGTDTINYLNFLNPITEEGGDAFIEAAEDFFQTVQPEYGTAYMYDAVISAGIAACKAEKNPQGEIEGRAHLEGLRSLSFTGATGTVGYGGETPDRAGAKAVGTSSYVAVNFVDEPEFLAFPEVARAGGEWESLFGFVYPDGSDEPPKDLRRPASQNYLSTGLRGFGLALCSILILCGVSSIVWIAINRKHSVLAASQPFFLQLIALGATVQASAIITVSFDEGAGWTTSQLDGACMAMPWLMCLGFMLVYTALFTKLWRVNKVLQFSRRKVTILSVAAPMVLLFLAALGILILWTIRDPLEWSREERNPITGESVGRCESNNVEPFVVPLIALMILPVGLSGFFARKTKDVDEAYAEGGWIFILITTHIQIIFVSTPVVIILNDLSTTGRYLGFILMMWSFTFATFGFIILPKVYKWLEVTRGWNTGEGPKRGEKGNSRVSGLALTVPPSGSVTASGNSRPREDLLSSKSVKTSAERASDRVSDLPPLHEDSPNEGTANDPFQNEEIGDA